MEKTSLTGKRGGLKESAAEEIGSIVRKIVDEKIKKMKMEIESAVCDKVKEVVEEGNKKVIYEVNKSLEAFYKKFEDREKEEELSEDGKEKVKSVVVKNVFQRLGRTGASDEERGGLNSGKLKENWREDLEYRKRLIRIIKGNNYEKAEVKAAIWIAGWIEEKDKKDLRVVKSDENSMWVECRFIALKERIMECKWEMRQRDWYRLDDVMTEAERKKRYKVEEYAAGIKVTGTVIKREWDKIRINKNLYGWDEKKQEIYAVKE